MASVVSSIGATNQNHRNTGLYLNGTLSGLSDHQKTKKPFLPYPDYNSDQYQNRWRGQYVACDGANGVPIDDQPSEIMTAYSGVPEGFPEPDIGSLEAIGLDQPICFDRYSRLKPYGLGRDEESRGEDDQIDLSAVNWGALQNKCLTRNRGRYENGVIPDLHPGIGVPDFEDRSTQHSQKRKRDLDDVDTEKGMQSLAMEKRGFDAGAARNHPHNGKDAKPYKSRSAVLIRTWDQYEYHENDLQMIRSLVSELSLQSGSEYHVFLFVQVKNLEEPIFTSETAHKQALDKYVPNEFHDMAVLWSEKVCQDWYPKIGEWSVYWQQFMPVQWFSRTHPEYDYVWNWEMDARYIGQQYQFMEQIAAFATKQPRKYLWERNSRYFIPALHGTYENFTASSNALIEHAKATRLMKTIWGPEPWSPEQTEHLMGDSAPGPEEKDDFSWGVGQEADFITLLPLWDPRQTWWSYRDKLFNYQPSDEGSEERPYPHVPRRVFINTFVRFSTRLLNAMHYENMAGLSMASEMWPGSVALQHGFKAVYAPHPIWQSHVWPAEYMDITFNADGWGAGSKPGSNIDDGRGVGFDVERLRRGEAQIGTGPNKEGKTARWTQERDSPYNPDREHYFAGWSWYFWSDFPRIIYWRWMGWKAGFSIVTIGGRKVTDELGLAGGIEVSSIE